MQQWILDKGRSLVRMEPPNGEIKEEHREGGRQQSEQVGNPQNHVEMTGSGRGFKFINVQQKNERNAAKGKIEL